jgi:hypothetical protein
MIEQEEVQRRLLPYFPGLQRVPKRAFELSMMESPEILARLGSYHKAVAMSGLMMSFAREEFDGNENVRVIQDEAHGGHGAFIAVWSKEEHWEYDLSLKKLNDCWLTCNSVTERRQNWYNNIPLFDFIPEINTTPNLTLGYKLVGLGEKIEVWITCPNGNAGIAWKFCLDDLVESTSSPAKPIIGPTQGVYATIPDSKLKKGIK